MRYNNTGTLIAITISISWILLSPIISVGQSLEEYLITAGKNNPSLRAEFTNYLASLEQVPQVTSLPDPDITFGYFISPIETRIGPQNSRLGVVQMFPWFGTLAAKGDVALEQAKSQFEQFQEKRNKLFFDVKQQWYTLYLLHKSKDILEENLKILSTLENLTLQRYETGQVDQIDILRVQIEKEEDIIQLELLKDEIKTNEALFNELLNRDTRLSVEVADTLAPSVYLANESELSQQVLSRNPRLTHLAYQSNSAKKAVKVAQKNSLLKFGVGFDYIFTEKRTNYGLSDNGNDAFAINFRVSIPLSRSKYNAQERQSELLYSTIQDKRLALENSLTTDLRRALNDLRDTERRHTLYNNIQIQKTRQAIDILLEEYTSSLTSIEEVLRLQQKLLKFQLSREQAAVDQHITIAYLDYLSGSDNITYEQLNFNY
ncbi:MAG: TolC family protein [Bacteroidetes bacterium]|nr:TolC family protein [Bacteroidota bacterium]